MSEVFVSYGHSDADWVRGLASELERGGVRVFFDEWDLELGSVVAHRLDAAIERSTSAIIVVSPESMARGWVREEYAVLLDQAVSRGLRLIPVIYGDVALPPFLHTRVALDFRHATPTDSRAKVAELIRVLRGEPRQRAPRAAPSWTEAFGASPGPARPGEAVPPATAEPTVVLCFARPDLRYAAAVADLLHEAGLPVWSRLDLSPGDQELDVARARIRDAAAIIAIMSDDSQESAAVAQQISEGIRLGRVFVPILLSGARDYQLVLSWYFDARGGRLPDSALVGRLRRLVDAAREGSPLTAAEALPPPLSAPAAPLVRLPAAGSLRRLREYLRAGDVEYADLLTTTMLLSAADRLDSGWILPGQAGPEAVPSELLAGIDALWTQSSNGRFGFTAQRKLRTVVRARHADFLGLSTALGWRSAPTDPIPRYREFVRSAVGQPGFFPTLRNPQSEQFTDWYEEWWQTVVAIHRRLQGERLL